MALGFTVQRLFPQSKKKKKLLVLLLTCFPTQQLFAMCHFIEFKLLSETLRPVFEAY